MFLSYTVVEDLFYKYNVNFSLSLSAFTGAVYKKLLVSVVYSHFTGL